MKSKELRENSCVQFITHYTGRYTYLDSVRIALEGGCRWIQLRMKEADEQTLLDHALQAQALCRKYGATFIIDDHVELVGQIHADGVHLGKNDMPIAEARKLLGDDIIIGGTANTFDDIRWLNAAGADYIGCGPYRYTTTKKNLSPLLGLEGYADIVRRMKAEGIRLPIVAIGGLTKEDIPALTAVGVDGIALSGSILRADNPIEEMKLIIKSIKDVWKN